MSTFHADLERPLPDLNRFARALTRKEEDAHDLVQDCVERAIHCTSRINCIVFRCQPTTARMYGLSGGNCSCIAFVREVLKLYCCRMV